MRRKRGSESKKYEIKTRQEDGKEGYKMQLGRITREWRGEARGESEI